MEALVDLGVSEDQVRILDAEKIVHVEVYLNARNILNKFQDWNSACGHID